MQVPPPIKARMEITFFHQSIDAYTWIVLKVTKTEVNETSVVCQRSLKFKVFQQMIQGPNNLIEILNTTYCHLSSVITLRTTSNDHRPTLLLSYQLINFLLLTFNF